MRFVETITRELFPISVNGFGDFLVHAFFTAPSTNLLRCFSISSFFFFEMALRNSSDSEGVYPAKFHGGAHQLFLIDRDAIGVLEDRLQLAGDDIPLRLRRACARCNRG